MAGYQPEYLNDGRQVFAERLSSPFANTDCSGSPASPFSPNQPPSFKPNVNRMKTKRWVTAKTYSYDGDDWGDTGEDDIYDAYLDPDTPPEQAPNHKIESQPTTGFPGQQDSSVAQISQQGQPPISSSQGDQAPKPLPFVRPADIYKRLNEERERQRLQTADSTPQPQGAAQHLHAVLAQQASTQQSTQNIPVIPSQELESPQNQNRPQEHAHNSTTGDSVLNSSRNITTSVPENPPHVPENSEITKAKLPELRPFSGFGDTFLNPVSSQDTGASGITQVASPESGSQEHGLDRRESVGFRSVVHQAFDIPETPATDTSSVARSNSETTSVISPIIRSETHSLITGDRTPTIPEEQPLRPVTPASEFKPGHRRSLTPPSANNSPARRPMITTGDPIPRPESACTLVPTPTEPQDGFQLSNDSEQVQQKPVEDERPTVKTASSYTGPVSQSETDSPSSTHSTDTSELNRRLQDDIIRSLTPNPAVGHREYQSPERPDDGHTSPRLHPESSLVTSEYQEYFAQQPSLRPSSPPAHHINPPGHDSSFSVPSEPDARPSQTQGGVDMPQPLEYNPDMSAINVPQHSLKKKFSWEMDFDEVAPPVQAQPQDQHAPAPAVDEQSLSPTDTIRKVDDAPPNQHVDHPVGSPPEHPSSPSPDNIQAQPAPGPGGEVQSEQDLKTDLSNENSPSSPLVLPESLPSAQPSPVHGRPEDTIASPISDGQKLLGFREIMAFKSPEQKISAFSRTRDQFAAMESGLQDWLKQTSATHPEHGDIVQQNGNVPQGSNAAQKAMPSRAKFPKLSSGSGSSRVHIRHASATPLSTMMHTQQVQAKGKDLLHSAGVLGGKAGDAAKGFFAKGRNKFRHSGSADKVDT